MHTKGSVDGGSCDYVPVEKQEIYTFRKMLICFLELDDMFNYYSHISTVNMQLPPAA